MREVGGRVDRYGHPVNDSYDLNLRLGKNAQGDLGYYLDCTAPSWDTRFCSTMKRTMVELKLSAAGPRDKELKGIE